jgi:hypothetical protein
MDDFTRTAQLNALLAKLSADLEAAKETVRTWTEAGASLSRSAAEERAKNQGAGKGLVSAFMGSKVRAALRAGAAASNAAIAKDVAQKRNKIAEGKRIAQERVRSLQADISAAKGELKSLASSQKNSPGRTSKPTGANDPIELMYKLKSAYESGLLSQDEYEEKRRKLLSEI